MTDNELLLAIADIVGSNTKALEGRIDRVETSLINKIDGVNARLSNKIDGVDACLSNKIDGVEMRVNNIMLRLENIIEPRLNNIESCYTSTYDKYRDSVEKMESFEMNIEVLQSVVKEYGVKLSALIA